jgi:hypothetical protein
LGVERFFLKTLFFNSIYVFFKFLIKTSPSHLSLYQPWPTCRCQSLWSNSTSGSVSPTGHTPSLARVVFLSRSLWRPHRLAAAALDFDEPRRNPLLR